MIRMKQCTKFYPHSTNKSDIMDLKSIICVNLIYFLNAKREVIFHSLIAARNEYGDKIIGSFCSTNFAEREAIKWHSIASDSSCN